MRISQEQSLKAKVKALAMHVDMSLRKTPNSGLFRVLLARAQ